MTWWTLEQQKPRPFAIAIRDGLWDDGWKCYMCNKQATAFVDYNGSHRDAARDTYVDYFECDVCWLKGEEAVRLRKVDYYKPQTIQLKVIVR